MKGFIMNKQFFFLSPIEVVKVTSQNLEEVAEWCGGSIQEAESRRVKGRMDKYVLVPTPSEKQIAWAFPGMFITKRLVVTVKDELRATFAVFRRDYFEKNYFDTPKDAADKTWERAEIEKNRPKPAKKTKKKERPYAGMHLTQNMGEALLEAQRVVEELQKKIDLEVQDRSKELEASMQETQEALASLGAEVIAVEEADETIMTKEIQEPVEWDIDNNIEILRHDHTYLKSCDSQLCSTDRYADGKHIFSDAIGLAVAEKTTVWTDHEGNTIPSPENLTVPPHLMEEQLKGKSESAIEMHFSGGVSPDVDVVAAQVRAYQNLNGGR